MQNILHGNHEEFPNVDTLKGNIIGSNFIFTCPFATNLIMHLFCCFQEKETHVFHILTLYFTGKYKIAIKYTLPVSRIFGKTEETTTIIITIVVPVCFDCAIVHYASRGKHTVGSSENGQKS